MQEQRAAAHGYNWRPRVQIVPVEGEEKLYRAEDVVRLAGGRRSSASSDDWHFLANLVAVIDSDWIDFLKPPTDSEEETDLSTFPDIDAARAFLETLGLHSVTSTEKVLAKAGEGLFYHDEIARDDAVRFTQIVAAFDAKVSDSFFCVTWDETIAGVGEGIIIDTTGEVEELLPTDWANEHLLHSQYFGPFTSCNQSQWFAWAKSEKSGLLTFAPVKETTQSLSTRNRLEEFLRLRNAEAPREYHYRSGDFQIIDFTLDKRVQNHLKQLAKRDLTVWCRVLKLLLSGPTKQWSEYIHASVREVGRKNTRPADCDRFAAAWIYQLAGRACVPDMYDQPRVPADLLMRTPDTEPLMGVEAFVKADYDAEANRPLLKLLGVRDTPSSPEKLVERIRALSGIASPPVHEVTKWYDALDKLGARCSPAELSKLKETFAAERLILSNDREWTTSGEIFRFTDDESLPGAPVVHSSVASLPLWGRLGVADRPTAELMIQWLQSLDSGAKLDGPTIRRVRACVQTYPEQVWLECGHWPTLDNTWSPVDTLEFRVERGSIERVANFFPAVRARIADFQTVSPEAALKPICTELRELGAALELRLTDKRAFQSAFPPKPWMVALGRGLQRVSLAKAEHTERARELGGQLATTQ